MVDAQCEISCLRASIQRRDAEAHLAQVELAYLNSLIAHKDQQLQRAEEQLATTSCSSSDTAPRLSAARRARDEILYAESEAEQMLHPLAVSAEEDPLASLPSLDADSSEALCSLSLDDIGTAAAAGQRVLASLRRAKDALDWSPCVVAQGLESTCLLGKCFAPTEDRTKMTLP
ncbi:unnamed protein product [Effrenium voratum]|nr:unnamed protein product [Effrenium voratum]